MISTFVATLFLFAAVQASPALFSRQAGITPLSSDQVNSYTPYTYFAKAAYCGAQVNPWNCRPACSSLPDFEIMANGGDGDGTQYWYVGYSKTLNSVVSAHQGTNRSQIKALLTDAHLTKGSLDHTLFPNMPDDTEVHEGFQDEHAKTASQVLSAVQSTMSKYNTQTVTLVGHSLGAALATLDAVYLHSHLPSSTTIKTVAFGLPRVGNKNFADYVDATVPITHITHNKDPIPIIPARKLGYVHPSGEVHIDGSGAWAACAGQENESLQCSDGAVSNIFKSDEADHDGPYNGIMLGRCE